MNQCETVSRKVDGFETASCYTVEFQASSITDLWPYSALTCASNQYFSPQWRRGVVVTALVVSTKLLYVEPG